MIHQRTFCLITTLLSIELSGQLLFFSKVVFLTSRAHGGGAPPPSTFFQNLINNKILYCKLKLQTYLLTYLTASVKIGDMTKFFLQLSLFNITVWSSRAFKPVSSSKIFFRVILGRPTLLRSSASHNKTLMNGFLARDIFPS